MHAVMSAGLEVGGFFLKLHVGVVRSWVSLILLVVSSSLCTRQAAASRLELVNGSDWQLGDTMVLGWGNMCLVNWLHGVNNLWRDDLLVDNWLDGLMNVI